MKKRDLPSPNYADALALTFAQPVQRKLPGHKQGRTVTEYDPHAELTAQR